MRKQLTGVIDNAITFLLLVVAGLTPLLFINQTTEFYEMPKLVFLIFSGVILLGLWIFSWILKGKVQITRTPLDIPLLLLLGIVVISAFFSVTKYSAIYGNFPRVHGSATAWVVYILLYFITVSNLKNLARIKTFLYVLFASGAVVAVATLLSYFGLYLPFNFAQSANFTPTGSSFATIAFLMLLLPLTMFSIINTNKTLPQPAALTLAILFSVTIVLIGSTPTLVVLVLLFALCYLVAKPHKVARFRKAMPLFLTPMIVSVLVFALSYAPFAGNPLYNFHKNFPREIQLPFAISWKVSASAFRDAPLIGTGPGSYLFDFTNYKPLEFNTFNFWNFSFDTAHNELLQIWGTLGLLGLLAIVIVILSVLNNSRKNLSLHRGDDQVSGSVLLPSFSVSALVAIVLLAIHVTTLVSLLATLFIFAVLMVAQKDIREKVMNLSMGLRASTTDDKQFDLLPVIVFVVFLVAAAPVLFTTYNTMMADYYHRQALLQAGTSGRATYSNLQKAETLNPYIDLYRVDMAQTNFALANAIATSKGPTKDNPKGSLTDTDRRTIQTLLSQAINEGRVAVALSPQSARNWEVLAAIYRNITGVAQNALTFSLDAYGRAIQRDPLNPNLRISVGGIYYQAKNYDLAIRFFSDAANLKPDNANAYFNLAIALRDKGDLNNAKVVADQAVTLLSKNKDSQDYKIATALQKELNDKISKNPSPTESGATVTGQQQTNIPEGVQPEGLESKPEVSTPAAVKKNPNANIPNLTPTPAANQ